MDKLLILEFPTKTEADTGLSIINQIAAAWWQSQGYTVINNELVPKNAATGLDDLTAQRTKTWDEVKISPNNTYYITSPSADPRFVNWRDYVPNGVIFPQDSVMPNSWIQEN